MEINQTHINAASNARHIFYSNKDLPSITLKDFLDEKSYSALAKKIKSLKYKIESFPLTHKYAVSKDAVIMINGLKDYLSIVVGAKIKKITFSSYYLTQGDYSIISQDALEKPGIDLIFDITPDWNDDFGGNAVFVDGSGEYYNINSCKNSLTIVARKKGIYRFFDYVNNYAGSKKRFIIIANAVLS